jgi:hypothetical protein
LSKSYYLYEVDDVELIVAFLKNLDRKVEPLSVSLRIDVIL